MFPPELVPRDVAPEGCDVPAYFSLDHQRESRAPGGDTRVGPGGSILVRQFASVSGRHCFDTPLDARTCF
eukprot:407235-Pyramimonas_sp.AAC.1